MFLFALSGLFNDHIGDIIKTQWIQSATYQPTILSHSQIFVFFWGLLYWFSSVAHAS